MKTLYRLTILLAAILITESYTFSLSDNGRRLVQSIGKNKEVDLHQISMVLRMTFNLRRNIFHTNDPEQAETNSASQITNVAKLVKITELKREFKNSDNNSKQKLISDYLENAANYNALIKKFKSSYPKDNYNGLFRKLLCKYNASKANTEDCLDQLAQNNPPASFNSNIPMKDAWIEYTRFKDYATITFPVYRDKKLIEDFMAGKNKELATTNNNKALMSFNKLKNSKVVKAIGNRLKVADYYASKVPGYNSAKSGAANMYSGIAHKIKKQSAAPAA